MAAEFSDIVSRDELTSPPHVAQLENPEVARSRVEDIAERHASALDVAEGMLSGRPPDFENVLLPLLDATVPSLSTWCSVDLSDDQISLNGVALRHLGLGHPNEDGDGDDCFSSLLARVPNVAQITERVFASGVTCL